MEEDEYEESYVMVELSGVADTEYFNKSESPYCRIWGLNTHQPILQMDRFFFVGGYEDVIGTNLILEDDEVVTRTDPTVDEAPQTFNKETYQKSANLFNMTTSHLSKSDEAKTNKKMRLYGHTFKRLSMHRAFLNKKGDGNDGETVTLEDEEEEQDTNETNEETNEDDTSEIELSSVFAH